MTRTVSIARFAAAAFFMLAAGCGELTEQADDNPYLGNMADQSYSGQVTASSVRRRVSASGKLVCIDEFKGQYVWADYCAPWCQPCVNQATAIKSLEKRFEGQVVLFTVMTSNSQKYEDVATRKNAQAWAGRFGLNPDRVVAADNLWAWTVPTHILYSPRGHTLYRSTGYLPAEEIARVITRYMRDWDKWAETGQKAEWMR